ncbi:hypothetical protein DFP72DRAFT_858423 [Ephemerocybe angulata]|uniref:Uncharacterized protein n=1 Tax=Ephemerocybe angulata TaxID=980116 RepID=A0A8H6HB31_9AGAR|nr:hypothetical protein DFP72DRAFT_858423 [Tulosesus angulatus]
MSRKAPEWLSCPVDLSTELPLVTPFNVSCHYLDFLIMNAVAAHHLPFGLHHLAINLDPESKMATCCSILKSHFISHLTCSHFFWAPPGPETAQFTLAAWHQFVSNSEPWFMFSDSENRMYNNIPNEAVNNGFGSGRQGCRPEEMAELLGDPTAGTAILVNPPSRSIFARAWRTGCIGTEGLSTRRECRPNAEAAPGQEAGGFCYAFKPCSTSPANVDSAIRGLRSIDHRGLKLEWDGDHQRFQWPGHCILGLSALKTPHSSKAKAKASAKNTPPALDPEVAVFMQLSISLSASALEDSKERLNILKCKTVQEEGLRKMGKQARM